MYSSHYNCVCDILSMWLMVCFLCVGITSTLLTCLCELQCTQPCLLQWVAAMLRQNIFYSCESLSTCITRPQIIIISTWLKFDHRLMLWAALQKHHKKKLMNGKILSQVMSICAYTNVLVLTITVQGFIATVKRGLK